MSIQQRRQDRGQPLLDDDEGAHDCPDDVVPPEAPEVAKFTMKGELATMAAMGWPMVVSFVCRIGMASTDTAFVGHLTNSTVGTFLNQTFTAEEYLAASSLSDMVVNILIVPPLAFNQVLNALVGQALGSGNPKMAGTWLQLSVFFLSLTYLPFLVAQYFVVGRFLHALGFSEDVCVLARTYSRFQLLWPVPNGIYQCMRFYFQAQGISRPAMYNNIAFLGINVLLNWFFVFGGPFQYLPAGHNMAWHGFGFIGAAVSISTSRILQPFTYFLYMFVWRKAHRDTWPGLSWAFLQAERVKSFLKQALPLIGTLIFQSVAGQVQTLLIAKLGSLVIAANAAVGAATQVTSAGFSAAFGAVAAVRVGFHLGRGDAQSAKDAMNIVIGMSIISSLVTVGIFWPLRAQLCSLITTDPATEPVATTLVAAAFVGAGLAQLVSILTGGVLSGQGRTLVTTLLSFGFELPVTIGSTAIMVFVVKLRGASGILWILWLGCAISLVELLVVGLIIACSNWQRYADEARQRNEAAQAEAAGEANAQTVVPLPPAETPVAEGVAVGVAVNGEDEAES